MKKVIKLSIIVPLIIINIAFASDVKVLKASGFLDVSTGSIISPAVILVEDGLIAEINPENLPSGAKIIDLGERMLLPGVIDMHTHLTANFFLVITGPPHPSRKHQQTGLCTVLSLAEIC
jgi:dihydroorotase-like cyclic amidohydrolase